MDQALARVCGVLSLAAAAMHAGLVDEHLEEWWGYGLFFILASLAQGLYGLILLALPLRPAWDPEDWRVWRLRLFTAGIVANVAVIVLYTISRSTGIPLFGPAAGEVEPIEALGLATKAVEMLTVLGLLVLVRRLRANRPLIHASS
ncbi:MAG: hypothetical protein AABY18_05945 [Candidatus Thermoplasmatota archaeon]